MAMTPEEMTDDQLIEPKTITTCVEDDEGAWNCTLSCGHEIVFLVQPGWKEVQGCAQCLDIMLERYRGDRL